MNTSYIVVGLGYGDEGKGSWVDHLVRTTDAKIVVRMNGGAQAGHNVVTPEGLSHSFAQIGAGTFVPGIFTILSRFMLVEPEALRTELRALADKGIADARQRLMVSAGAPVITPFSRQLNRIQEVFRGHDRHGSCGFGIGLTQGDVETLGEKALYMRDLGDTRHLREKLVWLGERRLKEAERFRNSDTAPLIDALARTDIEGYVDLFWTTYHSLRVLEDDELSEILRENDTVFEGAQGVLLDQHFGFFPHVTRSNCTFENAELLLGEAGVSGKISRIGLLRGYATRHGAGPFVTEDAELVVPPCTNSTNPWQGTFRLGWFDAVAARYALEAVGGVDTLAVTNLDRLVDQPKLRVAVEYSNADARFFSPKSIRAQRFDYPTLAERTRTMDAIVPIYEDFPGFGRSHVSREAYLDFLSERIGRHVDAYSATPDWKKGYR